MKYFRNKNYGKLSTIDLIFKILLVVIFLSSCTPPKDRLKPIVPENKKAPENAEDSFQVKTEKKNTQTNSTDNKSTQANPIDNNKAEAHSADNKNSEVNPTENKNNLPNTTDNNPFLPSSADNIYHIKINKTSLNKLFLMAPSLVDFYMAPRVMHLKPKVVTFNLIDNKLVMFEVDSRVIYDDIASNKLIQTFPVIQETPEFVEFDLNLGFSNISMTEDLGVAEIPSLPSKEEAILIPTQSYIQSAKIDKNGLTIIQNSRVRTDQMSVSIINVLFGMPANIQTAESNYLIQTRITPYKLNEHFDKKIISATDMKHLGYFTTDVTEKQKGTLLSLASHWDLSEGTQPITYVITKTTPPEFVQPIKEGILYWNHVFGREIIRVETDGDPSEIGSYRRNIVHWASWATAGFSVASLQSDPFTGELLSSNVYLTSAFPYSYAENVLTSLKVKTDSSISVLKNKQLLKTLIPKGFDYNLSCAYDMKQLTSEVFKQLSDPNAVAKNNPEFALKIQKDILRQVTAHEVGHTLGLRHNFAGSLGSQLATFDEHEKVFEDYLKDVKHNGAETSSSVMDYLNLKDVLLTGAHINEAVLPYDQSVIDWGYNSKTKKVDYSSIPPFCSDIEAMSGSVLDCKIFDTGKTPVSNLAEIIKSQNNNLMFNLYETLVELKSTADKKEETSFNKLKITEILTALPSPEDQAEGVTNDFENLYKQFTQNAQFISLDRSLGSAQDWFIKNKYQDALLNYQLKELNKYDKNKYGASIIGFIAQVIPLDDDLKVKKGWMTSEIEKFINSAHFCTGTTVSGLPIVLTADEKSEVARILREYGEKYEDLLLTKIIEKLAPVKSQNINMNLFGIGSTKVAQYENSEFGYNSRLPTDTWEPYVVKFVEGVVLNTNETQTFKLNDTNSVNIAKPLHSYKARLSAIKLASQGLFNVSNWMDASLTKIKTEEISRLNGLLKNSSSTLGSTSSPTVDTTSTSTTFYTLLKDIKNKDLKNEILKEIAVLSAVEQMTTANSSLYVNSDSIIKEIKN